MCRAVGLLPRLSRARPAQPPPGRQRSFTQTALPCPPCRNRVTRRRDERPAPRALACKPRQFRWLVRKPAPPFGIIRIIVTITAYPPGLSALFRLVSFGPGLSVLLTPDDGM